MDGESIGEKRGKKSRGEEERVERRRRGSGEWARRMLGGKVDKGNREWGV